jgi:cytochrome o ubiquinol oxidase operon protein cyoD
MAAGLTFFAFAITQGALVTGATLAAILLIAGAVQLYIQSRYFLHLDDTSDVPRWRLVSYVFTWLMLLIIVLGSLWVMNNLNYNMMMH